MKFIEKNLEDIIFESNRLELKKRGLKIEGKLLRQVRIGNNDYENLIDIFSYEYKIDGIYFKPCGTYSLIDEGF